VSSGGYRDAATGTTFNFTNSSTGSINVTSNGFYGNVFSGDVLVGDDFTVTSTNSSEVIQFSGFVSSIGLLFSTYGGTEVPITFPNGDGVSANSGPHFGQESFFGVTDTIPFNSLTIGIPSAILVDLEFQPAQLPDGTLTGNPLGFNPSSTPEPGSLVLLCTGLASVGGFGWMRKRKMAKGIVA
jgi:hypothetical protein